MTSEQILSISTRYREPWYSAYALLGVVVAGIIPILLPLHIIRSQNATSVGLVMAVLSSGMLASPLWGTLVDRRRYHRQVFWLGLCLLAISLIMLLFVSSLLLQALLALSIGIGSAAAATVANLFIVEFHPEQQWNARLSSLQMHYGGGQVVGLIIAGLFHDFSSYGLFIAALLVVLALGFALQVPKPPEIPPSKRAAVMRPSLHLGLPFIGLLNHSHRPNFKYISKALRLLGTPFGRFLLVWFTVTAGFAAFFALYPLLMERIYNLSASFASWGFAGAVAMSLFFYRRAGIWSHKLGSLRLLRLSLSLRLLAFSCLGLLANFGSDTWNRAAIALVFFTLVVLTWPLLSVSGTGLAASLSGLSKGEALGIYNSVTAFAGIIGCALAGLLASLGNYSSLPWIPVFGLVLGIAIICWSES